MKAVSLIALLASVAVARAATVAHYDFSVIDDANESTNTFLSASIDTEPGSLASDITSPATHNGGLVHPEFGDIYDNAGNQAVGWSARGNNPAQNFSIILPIDTYFSFNVAAGPGATLGFSTLSLLTGVSTTLAATTTANDYTLSYSLDGVTFSPVGTVLAGAGATEAATLTGVGSATATISFDLSGVAALQGVTGTAYFELDPVAAAGSSQNGVMSQRGGFMDDLVVEATVTVVPEPTVAMLGGLGLLVLLLQRRK
jgi:hypothetical protein